jgi:hypothetical protein
MKVNRAVAGPLTQSSPLTGLTNEISDADGVGKPPRATVQAPARSGVFTGLAAMGEVGVAPAGWGDTPAHADKTTVARIDENNKPVKNRNL